MQLKIQENVTLGPLTTLGVGGSARFFAAVTKARDVEEAVAFAQSRDLALFVLGGGSNLVISDRGWNGLVVQMGITGIDQRPAGARTIFDVGAGIDWDQFVAHSVALDCSGIECLSGIPGSVGGTPVQNVGAYGQEVSASISSVAVFDLAESKVRELPPAKCEFSYRKSIFNTTERERYIILRVSYLLTPGGQPALRYADLQKYFASRGVTPTLSQVRQGVREIRAAKGMLISPGDPDSKSAGSFFKNPVLSPVQHTDLIRRSNHRNLQVPIYPALSEQRKVSAAWLVENSGFKKGYVRGRVAISSKHALAIVNRGGASAAEIVVLRNEIQARVKENWGIWLETEPVFVGF